MIPIASNGHGNVSLPTPGRDRWQPLRAGLTDLFLYDREEFWFHSGNLLLRGNNGTGKSKVLALTLPFLFDANLSAQRVEPDGDHKKRMEWNLLLNDRYEERLGYTWLELGRREPDGRAVYVTLGCGLKAVKGRGIAAHWFFISSQRVGEELWLVGPNDVVLSRERLAEAIGDRGRVYEQAEAYRRAVDERLFQLGPARYGALVNLLIQLRQPQLSRRPREEQLSAALSEALAPLDQAVLDDVAEAFHDIEQQRDELRALEETHGHVERFLTRYALYARVVTRRQGQVLRSAHSEYENTRAELTRVGQLRQAEEQRAAVATERLAGVRRELEVTRAEQRALGGRSELRQLKDASDHAGAARKHATAAGRHRDEASGRAEAGRRQVEEAESAARASRDKVDSALGETARAAAGAGFPSDHAALLAPLLVPDGYEEAQVEHAARSAGDLARRRASAIEHLDGLATQVVEARRQLTTARTRLTELAGERDRAAERKNAAEQAVQDAAQELAAAWRRWLAEVGELRVAEPDELLAELLDWAETLAGDNPALKAVARAAATAREALAERHAELLAIVNERRRALEELRHERDRLTSGQHEQPPVPYTRAPGARDGRPGAPLWKVIDFRDGVGQEEQAGLEAALEASGLLDGWLTPDGRLLDRDLHDTMLTAGDPRPSSLGALLQPAIDRDDPAAAALTAATIERVLAGIGLGAASGHTWVDVSGRWQLGVATGSWSKASAAYIGEGAREAARRRRVVELAALIAQAETALVQSEAERDAVIRRQAQLQHELDSLPSEQPLRDAGALAAAAARHLTERAELVTLQERAVEDAARAAGEAEVAHRQAAGDLRLPVDPAALVEVRNALQGYRVAAAGLWPEMRLQAACMRALGAARRQRQDAEVAAQNLAVDAERAETEAQAAERQLETVRGAIGATVEELTARLERAGARIVELGHDDERLDRERLDAVTAAGQAKGREELLAENLENTGERRGEAIDAFRRLVASGLLAVALSQIEVPDPAAQWAPDPAVRLARRVESGLQDTDASDAVWERLQKELSAGFNELSEAMSRHGHRAAAEQSDGRFIVSIQFNGRERRPDELAGLLAEEIDHRERLLSAREREVLEEHLVNEVASHLQERISDAEAQVQRMNGELERRPTSTGMRLRFHWQPRPDGPPGLAQARARLLRQAAEAWSPEDRIAVSAFLQAQINAERVRNESGTWADHLRAALDYRAWHRFSIERWQDGRWRAAAGPASGGERVLTVTLPLFAAASAHLGSANRSAPRLVMLDEAFAGVDDDSRAKSLGLLATFDLDVTMTSEREWACYPTVPGIAICHLSRREGIDAIHVSRWEWDGKTRLRADPQLPPLKPPGQNGDGSRPAP